MKKRTATVGGGLILAGIALGMLLNLFRGPGGGGEGSNVLVQSPGEDTVPLDSALSKPLGEQAEQSGDVPVQNASQQNPASPESAPPPEVVDVVIDDREYQLRTTSADGQTQLVPIALPKLLEVVRSAKGTEDGIRVRIVRTDASRAAAEKLLHQSLLDAGVEETAMQWDP